MRNYLKNKFISENFDFEEILLIPILAKFALGDVIVDAAPDFALIVY